MILRTFYDQALAQASYLVGCGATGEALIIDPARYIEPYLQSAEERELKIAHIAETHIHADFVSGTRELAAATGATKYLSDEGEAMWKYAFVDDNTVLLKDNDAFMVGNVKVRAIHTPGHTPEHLIFEITDTANSNVPLGYFTGDFLFVGSIGRPDLLEEAAGIMGTREVGAKQQFENIQHFKGLSDHLQIWPGHGAGSACGKSLGELPSTTLGYEKLTNEAFHIDEETDFVDWLLAEQPEAPTYFAEMKRINKVGPALLKDVGTVTDVSVDLKQVIDEGALVIDARSAKAFGAGHIPGSMSVPAEHKTFSTYAGWFIDYDKPVYLIAPEADAARLVLELRAIGVDKIAGVYSSEIISEAAQETLLAVDASQLKERMQQNGLKLVDVRNLTEYEEKHIEQALHIPLGYLPRQVDEIPRDDALVIHCASGVRAQIAASWLQKQGFSDVANFDGAFEELETIGLAVHRN